MKFLINYLSKISVLPLTFALKFSTSNYLYDGDKEAYPVIEYKSDEDRPSFLYDANNGPRIVEFYSPWCPHCVHYKPEFIKLAKDLSEIASTPIKIHAISCLAYGAICKKQKVHGYPTVKLFKAGSTDGEVMYRKKGGPAPSEILKMLNVEETGKDDKGAIDQTKPAKMDKNKKAIKSKVKQEKITIPQPQEINLKSLPSNEIFYDAALSFRFSLKTGIFMQDGPLSEEKAMAFKDWITLIKRTWPSSEDMNTYLLAKEILQNFDTVVKNEATLTRIVSKYSKKDPDWSASCKKGTNYLGFTCGLWQLFHIMSVGVLEWNKRSSTSDIITSVHASDTLRNFIANFSACSVCQQHFLQMYDSCSLNRCTRLTDDKSTIHSNWLQFPLWLWEVHNDVNVRLKAEDAITKKIMLTSFEKSQAHWPSEKECEFCRQNENTEWKDEIVLDFIMNHYWPGKNIHTSQKKPFISNVNEISTNSSKQASNGWSMFAIFLSILIISWFWFKKWRKSLSGRHKKFEGWNANKNHLK